ncbi:MAG TPA: flagellar basal-body MS-ring/collar protein FliF [Stellaceae bacterium]|nr:flagellar basal-body MS-ring/collar protein FliF [Stellaceae bacterium]
MNGLIQNLAKLGTTRLMAIGGAGLAMVALFAFLATRLTTPGMSLLYADLDLKDSAQIVQKLDAMNIPYQLRADGAQILVPNDQVAKLRMTMAENGLPSGGTVGYELFDKSEGFGTSSFAQNINQLRALEGELSRTITGLGPVQAARVHLVLPRRELFARDTQEATASVVVKLRGAERLSKSQVAAIQHLVATSVPSLKPSRVSVVDGEGNLLARGDGEDATSPTGAATEELRVNYENRVSRKVEEMLERSLGPGKVRVDVHADMDFDRITTSSETFDPDGQVVRSTQTVNQNDSSTNGNQNQGVTVANNLPNNGGTNSQQTTSSSKSGRNEETVNYEISKTVRNQVRDTGAVKRLSVAVLVDGTYTSKPDGTKTYVPRSADEMKQINSLVRSAIGFDDKRGDTIEVANLRFVNPDEPLNAGPPPLNILGFDKTDLMHMGETLVLAVVALLVILLVVRPLIFRLLESTAAAQDATGLLPEPALPGGGAVALPPPPGGIATPALPGQPAGVGAPAIAGPKQAQGAIDQMIDIGQVEGRVAASSIRKIGEIVEKHPEEAVAIVRSWMYQGT